MKFAKFNKGILALQKEANTWWGGITKMEKELKLSAEELSTFFWKVSDFSIDMTKEELDKYSKTKIQIAEIVHGRLWKKEIPAYHFGNTYLVKEKDYL